MVLEKALSKFCGSYFNLR